MKIKKLLFHRKRGVVQEIWGGRLYEKLKKSFMQITQNNPREV